MTGLVMAACSAGVSATFRSEPSGAEVVVDGRPLCATPCTTSVRPGTHTITMKLDGFETRSERAAIGRGTHLFWQLTPATGPTGESHGEPDASSATDAGASPHAATWSPPPFRRVVMLGRPLERHEVIVEAEDPALGDADRALVVVVVFADFACPFSARLMPRLRRLVQQFAPRVRLVFKPNPASHHADAATTAAAALCAHAEGKFWELADALFATEAPRDPVAAGRLAAGIGLDPKRIEACVEDARIRERIEVAQRAARSVRADETPTTFVNGRKLRGAVDYGVLRRLVEKELKVAEDFQRTHRLDARSVYPALVSAGESGRGLSAATIERTIGMQLGDFVWCYQDALGRHRKLEGRLDVSFAVDPAGRVSNPRAKADSLADPQLLSCVAAKMRRWRFPAPKGGASVPVSYPLGLVSRR